MSGPNVVVVIVVVIHDGGYVGTVDAVVIDAFRYIKRSDGSIVTRRPQQTGRIERQSGDDGAAHVWQRAYRHETSAIRPLDVV